MSFLVDHAALVIAGLAFAEAALCAYLIRRGEWLKRRLDAAVDAAEVAARAASLAAPGGIDPEVVVEMLRSGRNVTLDSVYEAMGGTAGLEA